MTIPVPPQSGQGAPLTPGAVACRAGILTRAGRPGRGLVARVQAWFASRSRFRAVALGLVAGHDGLLSISVAAQIGSSRLYAKSAHSAPHTRSTSHFGSSFRKQASAPSARPIKGSGIGETRPPQG